MGKVYSKADSVTVWLGPEADGSHLLEEFLPNLSLAFADFEDGSFVTSDDILLRSGKPLDTPE
jgi:hypothetical protein